MDDLALVEHRSPLAPGELRVVVERAFTRPPRAFSELVDACVEVDHHAPFDEHTLLTLQGQHHHRHARLQALVPERGGSESAGLVLAGYAVLMGGLDRSWYVEIAVAPAMRGHGIGTALLLAARDHVASHGGGRLRAWSHQRAAVADRLAGHAGMQVERRLLFLVRPLPADPPPDPPPGVRIRSFGRGRDEDAWLALNNAAFTGHPEQGNWTLDDLEWRLDAEWSDPSRFVLAEDDTGLLAGVWTKLPPGGRQGELYVVAAAPGAQGRGLGRLVVTAALAALNAAGADSACLYCDAANEAALRMYERVGFRVDHEDRCYMGTITPSALAAR